MKRKKISVLLLGTLLVCSCNLTQEKECGDFKTGEFFIHSELNGNNYLISRKDTLQIETEKETGNITEWKITWLNDCEYNLLMLRDNYGYMKSLPVTPSLNFAIVKSGLNYYIFKTKFDNSNQFIYDTINRIN